MLKQLVELAADLGGRVAVRREIVLVFILQRRVVKLGEGVVLQGEFQRDLLAAVLHVAAAINAVRIGLGLGQLRRIDDLVGVAVQPVPEGGNQLAGLHRRRRHRVEILHDVIRRIEVVDGGNALADEIIGELAVLAEDGLLRVARVLAHVIAILVFHAAIHQRIEFSILEFELNGNLLNAAVIVKPTINAVRVFLRGGGQSQGDEQNHQCRYTFHVRSSR